ncbi:hypothetical protein [Phytohabitans rumicis]|uniref:hypothetical protein n=1 Tax=Phytohabitans rumicis TaxID=1076125 RepID=UPI001FE57E8D|nr:hypothetical protein [Phytohabitans rumicis]
MAGPQVRPAGFSRPARVRPHWTGEYLLGRGPALGVLWATAAACLGVAGLAAATGGWVLGVGPAGPPARVLAGAGGLLLLYLHPVTIAAGVVLLLATVGTTLAVQRRQS